MDMKRLTFLLLLAAGMVACKENTPDNNDPVGPKPPYVWTDFSMGADLSYVNEIEDFGGVYRDSSAVKDPFLILKSYGCNTVRVRLWHDPQWVAVITGGKTYSDLADVEKTIGRAKALGMAVNLDFHYSDEWADPGNQVTPAAWEGAALAVLEDSVYNYTFSVLNYLHGKGLTPEMVQIGNETNQGMLWPAGKVQNNNWQPFCSLLNAGIRAVRDFSAANGNRPKIILHVAGLHNAKWWIENVMNNGVADFDILGISHYCKWAEVKTMAQVTSIIKGITTTQRKGVILVETAYPWTGDNADGYNNIFSGGDSVQGYSVSPQGQQQYLEDLVQAVLDGGGSGIHYWEPAWITSSMPDKWGTGSSWDNVTWFDFSGNALPSLKFMNAAYNF